MATENFKASVQYNDLKGSAAADRADFDDAEKWLSEKTRIQDGEHLVGIKVFISENHGDCNEPIFVEFLIDSHVRDTQRLPGKEGSPIELKRVRADMSINDFFALFKRFEITLSPDGDLENKYYRYAD
ncbi:hypothetical protein [Vreelandella titanicae]|uniref:hypothetical protein n=1 Tax=Vreelandella titanicae TaxID=664683 RepID=UPI0016805F99|nr:hypothetical protein [Halomonas titanicae]QNU61065.1 hypothetical protein HZS52_14865 [Halomonas titanicae]